MSEHEHLYRVQVTVEGQSVCANGDTMGSTYKVVIPATDVNDVMQTARTIIDHAGEVRDDRADGR